MHGSADEAVGSAENAYGDRVGHDALATTEPGITLFDGYNTLFDLRRTVCAAPTDARVPSIGQVAQHTTIKIVRSDTELAKEIGVDATFALKTPLAGAQGSASLLRNFKASTSSVNYLIQAVQSYIVVSNAPVALSEEARELLRTSPKDFLVRCGDRFVSGVTYQAKIDALVTFETASEERAQSLQGSIAGNGSNGVTTLDGSIKSKLTNASKKDDVKTSVVVTAQGFEVAANAGGLGAGEAPSSTDALIALGGTLEQKLTRIDEVAGNMAMSLRADRDRDAAGFAANNMRNAIPAALHLTRYGIASNAPVGVETSEPFKQNQEMLRQTEAYLRSFGQLKLKMEHAYRYEIRPFQDAGPESQAEFNLMPPARPVRWSSELRPIATKWAERFRDDDGVNVGSQLLKVQDAIATCVENAKIGDFADCKPGEDPSTLPIYKEGMSSVADYLSTGRVVKMRVWVVDTGATMTYGDALARCADMNGWVDRLPSADEAARIAPIVAGYAGGSSKSIWTADTRTCKYDDSGMSFLSNPLAGNGLMKQGCESWSLFSHGDRSVVCVPQSGPVGKRDDL